MNSRDLYKKSLKLFPGGVNSPVRAFPPYPFFVRKARGSKLVSVEGDRYIDYCMSYGALLFGHTYHPIIDAVDNAIKDGSIFGAPSEKEFELAELLAKIVPSVEMMRFVSTGTEAAMHAIRLARGFTGRKKVVKFEGCYHGAHDSMLVKVGSGATAFGVSSSLGVIEDVAKNTVALPFNNSDKVEDVVRQGFDEIAAIIVEPVMGNCGLILPKASFLQKLKKLSKDNGILLIFDEIITGFRLGLGGAQEYFGIQADLVTFGKVIGGGLPFALFGGRSEIMENLAPKGKVYQAGTYSGNPLCVSVALCVMRELAKRGSSIYTKLDKNREAITNAILEIIGRRGLEARVNFIRSMFQVFFTKNDVVDYSSALSSDTSIFKKYFSGLLASHVFIPPSQFETCFLSTAHTREDIDKTIETIGVVLSKL